MVSPQTICHGDVVGFYRYTWQKKNRTGLRFYDPETSKTSHRKVLNSCASADLVGTELGRKSPQGNPGLPQWLSFRWCCLGMDEQASGQHSG